MDFISLKRKVWNFKLLNEKFILYFVVCLERFDYEVYCIFVRLFDDINWEDVF